ncbi:MAG: hypothetical protein AB7Y46_11425 [Armatimonadota bacterium]
MDDRQIEQRLRTVRLAEPDPALRERLLARAERRMARRGPSLSWALAAAAALLIAANLVFGQVHGARMRALVGEPATALTAADAQVYAQAIAERARLMSEALDEPWPDAEPQTNSDGGERRGARPDAGRQTRRPAGRAAAWA